MPRKKKTDFRCLEVDAFSYCPEEKVFYSVICRKKEHPLYELHQWERITQEPLIPEAAGWPGKD